MKMERRNNKFIKGTTFSIGYEFAMRVMANRGIYRKTSISNADLGIIWMKKKGSINYEREGEVRAVIRITSRTEIIRQVR